MPKLGKRGRPAPTWSQMITDEIAHFADEAMMAGFDPDEANHLYRAIRHAITAAELEASDSRALEGDDESEIRGY